MPIINSGERMNSMVLDQPLMAGLSFLLFLPYNTASLINLKYDSTSWRKLDFPNFREIPFISERIGGFTKV
ncbi:MAG: hypothetical protein KTR30_33010 [Saprospiraceae bacterium]|nr:hypothetical protein [Saprospiraceae bacterium]